MSNQTPIALANIRAPVSNRPQTLTNNSTSSTSSADRYSYQVGNQGGNPAGIWTPDPSALTPQRVTRTAELRESGLEIMFLPTVLSGEAQAMKDDISNVFGVPPFFWTKTGYKSNGFFSHNQSPLTDFDGASYGSMSRFLIKELNYKAGEYSYKWQYISFVTLWYSPNHSEADATPILLCFDLTPELKESILEAFRTSDPSLWRNCPLGLFSVILPVIAFRFDGALWGFKEPIRDIENSRIEYQNSTGNTTMQERYVGMQERYMKMHDLSRHVIHEVETLESSARTVASIANHHRRYGHAACHEVNGSPDFDFYKEFLENLGCRAQAFEKRLQLEITLAFNLAAADDNAVANQTQKDGRELTQLVSTATLLFLPGSFVSSFFGMNFFDFGDKKISTSDQIYIFVVATIIVTILGFGIWKRFGTRQSKVESKPAPSKPVLLPRPTTFV